MRLILASLLISLGTTAAADAVFVGKQKPNPSIGECAKVINNGTLIRSNDRSRTFLYGDQMVTIVVGPDRFRCIFFDNLKKN